MEKINLKPDFSPQSDAEKMKNKIKTSHAMVQSKNLLLNAKKISGENDLKSNKQRLLQKLFQMMATAGVDLGSLESINQFLQNLDATDPDLRQLFEDAFGNLLGEREINQEQPLNSGENLINRNLSQETMMPRQ